MLLLDEPTNHLDAESVAWLERYLHDFPGTVVAITHDRYFLDNVAEAGFSSSIAATGIPYEGNYTSWLEQKKHAARAGREDGVGAAAHARSASSSGCAWRRARGRRRTRRASRSTRSWSREETAEKIMQHEIVIPPPPRLGNDVVIAKDLEEGVRRQAALRRISTFSLPRGGIVGIIGPNGAGKTTLFRMIVGQEKPDGGSLKVGETVQIAYVDQSRTLDADKTAWQEISGGQELIMVGKKELNSRAYLSSFNFRGTDQQKKVGDSVGR